MESRSEMLPVRVGAVFERGRVRPVWFVSGSRRVQIDRITYRWKEREGMATLLHFSIDAGGEVYDLVCRLDTLEWFLCQEG